MKKLKSLLGYLLFATALFAQTPSNPDVTETVLVNSKVTLQVTAEGTLPITYNWFKNGVAYGTPFLNQLYVIGRVPSAVT